MWIIIIIIIIIINIDINNSNNIYFLIIIIIIIINEITVETSCYFHNPIGRGAGVKLNVVGRG